MQGSVEEGRAHASALEGAARREVRKDSGVAWRGGHEAGVCEGGRRGGDARPRR